MVKRDWIQCTGEQAIVSQTDRLVAIDIVRSVAMLLALAAHAGFQTSLDLPVAATLALRIATPLFIVLFGAMVTLVYPKPRAKRSISNRRQVLVSLPSMLPVLLAQHSGPGLYGFLQFSIFGPMLIHARHIAFRRHPKILGDHVFSASRNN
jgi:uncharacterized membrane protein